MVSCSGFGLPLHAQLLRLFVTKPYGTLRKGGCFSDQLRRRTNPREAISRAQWKDFFVFTVVRNPWTRMLCAFNMFNEGFLHRFAMHMIFCKRLVYNSLKECLQFPYRHL